MNHVVATIHPFVVMQNVDVYMNGECIKSIECPLKDLTKVCYNLCKEYGITQLDLAGQQLYAMHVRDELAATDYADFAINITIH